MHNDCTTEGQWKRNILNSKKQTVSNATNLQLSMIGNCACVAHLLPLGISGEKMINLLICLVALAGMYVAFKKAFE